MNPFKLVLGQKCKLQIFHIFPLVQMFTPQTVKRFIKLGLGFYIFAAISWNLFISQPQRKCWVTRSPVEDLSRLVVEAVRHIPWNCSDCRNWMPWTFYENWPNCQCLPPPPHPPVKHEKPLETGLNDADFTLSNFYHWIIKNTEQVEMCGNIWKALIFYRRRERNCYCQKSFTEVAPVSDSLIVGWKWNVVKDFSWLLQHSFIWHDRRG